MSRPIPAALLSALTAETIRPALFVEALFAGGVVRLWSGYGEVTAGGQTWQGAGNLLDISLVGETQEVRAQGVTVTLSGIPSALLSLALQEPYHGRIARIHIGAFGIDGPPNTVFILDATSGVYVTRDISTVFVTDPATVLILDAVAGLYQVLTGAVGYPSLFLLFAGRMDVMSISETGETATIGVAVENRLIDLQRPAEVLYTSETQERLFPGDKSLEYVAGLTDQQLTWGRG